MNLASPIADLKQERLKLDQAIRALEALAIGTEKRRGRPPSWVAAMNSAGKKAPAKKQKKAPAKKATKAKSRVAKTVKPVEVIAVAETV